MPPERGQAYGVHQQGDQAVPHSDHGTREGAGQASRVHLQIATAVSSRDGHEVKCPPPIYHNKHTINVLFEQHTRVIINSIIYYSSFTLSFPFSQISNRLQQVILFSYKNLHSLVLECSDALKGATGPSDNLCRRPDTTSDAGGVALSLHKL